MAQQDRRSVSRRKKAGGWPPLQDVHEQLARPFLKIFTPVEFPCLVSAREEGIHTGAVVDSLQDMIRWATLS
jgi:hypothetical protein